MKSIILVLLLFITTNILAQLSPSVEINSPNVTAIQTVENIPIDYFTGKPNIDIPIYNLNMGSINVPISLSYNPDIVKPAEHPSWVGLGWNLNCGGVITRTVHGLPDEYYNFANSEEVTSGYIQSANGVSFQAIPELLGIPYLYALYNSTDLILEEQKEVDLEADEFNFSFLGHSGKIIYDADNSNWIVISDENIEVAKVEYNHNYYYNEIGDNSYSDNVITTQQFNSSEIHLAYRYIYRISLVLEDGTYVTFGNDKDAIEYSFDYNGLFTPGTSEIQTDAWYIKKIVDIQGNMIEFNYRAGDPICKVSYNVRDIDVHAGNQTLYSDYSNDKEIKNGKVIYPTYLSTINSGYCSSEKYDHDDPNESPLEGSGIGISFNSSNTDRLTYDLGYLKKRDKDTGGATIFPNNFHWRQLDNITINGFLTTRYTFDYETNDYGIENINYTRLMLYGMNKASWRARASDHDIVDQYEFEYNDINLGDFNVTSVNLLGYDNSSIVSKTNALLKKIIYPTGGTVQFEWEPHSYGKILFNNKLIDVVMTSLNLGNRIKSIKYFDDVSSHAVKEYNYEYQSSGVLNGLPEILKSNSGYTIDFQRSACFSIFNETYCSPVPLYTQFPIFIGHIESTNPLNVNLFAYRSPIGYSKVKEVDVNNGINITYEFYNFQDDVWKVCISDQNSSDPAITGIDNLSNLNIQQPLSNPRENDVEYQNTFYSNLSPLDYRLEVTGWLSSDAFCPRITTPIVGQIKKKSKSENSITTTTNYYYEIDNDPDFIRRLQINNQYIFQDVISTPDCSLPLRRLALLAFAEIRKEGIASRCHLRKTITKINGKFETHNEYVYNEAGQLGKEIYKFNKNSEGEFEKVIKYHEYSSLDESSFGETLLEYNILNRNYFTQSYHADYDDNYTLLSMSYFDYADSFPFNPKKNYQLSKDNQAIFNEVIADEFYDKEELYNVIESKIFCAEEYSFDKYNNISSILRYNAPNQYYIWSRCKYAPIAKISSKDALTIPTSLQYNIELFTYTGSTNVKEKVDTELAGKNYKLETFAPYDRFIINTSDINGRRTDYFYDDAGRLESVSDDNYNLIYKYYYNKKNSSRE